LSELVKTALNGYRVGQNPLAAPVTTPVAAPGFAGQVGQARRNQVPGLFFADGHRPRNQILASLPADVWARLAPHTGQSLLIQGEVLIEAGKPIEKIYFPNNGLLSLMQSTKADVYVETALIGSEGLTNAFELLDESVAASRTLVQISGTACWLPADVLRSEFRWAGFFQRRLLRFLHWQEIQSSQCALCNRLHAVEERLARWLMMAHDRVPSSELFLTHAAISHLLGTRRSGVTVALNNLEATGAISCTRGRIVIEDVQKLHGCSCECYEALSAQSASLLQGFEN
jgi:CRP-like cAMP-binding protein